MTPPRRLSKMPFETDGGIGHRARIGMVVLATDYTLEHEFHQVARFIDGVALYGARIPMGLTTSTDNLRAMGRHIAPTVELLLPGDRLDVVAYGCTSATAILGEGVVAEVIQGVKPRARVTTPVTAAHAALRAFGARKIGILTPYTAEVNAQVQNSFEGAGFDVPAFGSFDEHRERVVGAIAPESIREAVLTLADEAPIDAVFISCTNLRALDLVPELERTLGLPVTSSNHAMIWHSLRLAGIEDELRDLGLLFALDA